MSTGVIDQIEHDALALVETVRIEQSVMEVQGRKVTGAQEEARRAEAGAEEESRVANARGSVEGQVYFDLATEALAGSGIKALKDVGELLSDGDPGKFSVDGKSMATMETDIKKMKRAPGVYGANGDDIGKAGMSLTERCNLAASSIMSQGECNLKSWAMKGTDMPSTQMSQNLVFGKQLASEAALNSVARARMIQAPMMGPGGMGSSARQAELIPTLANGPKFSMADEEEFDAEEMFG